MAKLTQNQWRVLSVAAAREDGAASASATLGERLDLLLERIELRLRDRPARSQKFCGAHDLRRIFCRSDDPVSRGFAPCPA